MNMMNTRVFLENDCAICPRISSLILLVIIKTNPVVYQKHR